MAENSFLGSLHRLAAPVLPSRLRPDIAVVPVVRLSGAIGTATALRPGITLATVARTLDRAFAVKGAKAVALVVNSPGGAPAQSHLVHRRIRALADEKQIRVIAFVEDVAASGGYMLACAADEIVADPFAVIGSIGVISAGFGFDKALEKLGVDRRVYTAGERKAMLDPFQPERPEDVKRLKAIQKEIHGRFIDLVRARRGGVLAGPDRTVFSGDFWAAPQALEFGLIDAMGDLRSYLKARYGDEVLTPLMSPGGLFGRRTPGVAGPSGVVAAGAGVAEALLSAAEERALWSRYGL